jgi:hypothetical protein
MKALPGFSYSHFNFVVLVGPIRGGPSKNWINPERRRRQGTCSIGILKAIDSAGLKIDYITGTSMGAVIGSLYAIGYSGDTLEKLTRNVDWDPLLSNQSGLRNLFMEEKDEYAKYDIELPWVNNNFKIATGFLEAEELWLKLSELYFPLPDIKDFTSLIFPLEQLQQMWPMEKPLFCKTGKSHLPYGPAWPSLLYSRRYTMKTNY